MKIGKPKVERGMAMIYDFDKQTRHEQYQMGCP